MNYSFFGTCSNDYEQFFGCLETIVKQSILPKEIILVNSGEKDIEKNILEKINNTNIKLIYIKRKLSRVKSLNIAIDLSSSIYSFRFDTRSRFSFDYARNALNILIDGSLKVDVTGGVPNCLSESKKFQSKLCATIMNRSYIFFYPKHRLMSYSGYANSIYLGCFNTKLLQDIRFNESQDLLSEDSLIINDFLKKGFKAYISSDIKVSYVCRSLLINILRLFNTYGYCRGNTIFISKKIFISSRHLLVFIISLLILITLLKYSIFSILLFPLILLLWNLICEIKTFWKCFKLHIPFCATMCQLSWIFGFIWSIFSIFKKRKVQSNFIS